MKLPGRLKEALTVWLVFYLFFLLFLANNFSAAHDSINYLNNISRGEHLFHQHHLLYHFLARQWLTVTQSIFSGVSEHYLIESFTAIWGAAILSACYLFFRNRFGFGRATSLAGICVIAFSFGLWFYSVNIEVYTPPAFFVLSCLYVMSAPVISPGLGIKLGLLNSLAILFHQFNVLFAVVVIAYLYQNRKHLPAFMNFMHYALIGIVITGMAYFLAGWFAEGHNSFPSLIAWMEGYAVGHDYWQPMDISTPLHVATGFGHAFIGGHFIFRVPAIESYLLHSFESHGLKDEIFLAASISHTLAWLLTVLTVFFAVIFVVLVIRFIRHYKVLRQKLPHSIRPMLQCVFVYSLFFCFWMPEILEFWILQMIIVWLLLLGSLSRISFPLHTRPRKVFVTLAALLFTINYLGSIRWFQDADHDLYYQKVSRIKDVATPNDLMIMQEGWILKDFAIRFVKAPVMSPEDPDYDPTLMQEKIDQVLAKKGKVYVYPDRPKEGVQSLSTVIDRYLDRQQVFSESDPVIDVIE